MHTLVDTPAFRFEDNEFEWADVVLAAVAWGEWQELERSLAEGLACAAEADELGEQVDGEALHADVVSFRRARRLLAGDEYLRWLAERSLATADLHSHLERNARRRRAGRRIDRVLAAHEVDPDQLSATIRAEAILSGRLEAWAERLARCAAASRGLAATSRGLATAGEGPAAASEDSVSALVDGVAGCPASAVGADRDRAARIVALLAAYEAFCDRAVTQEKLERCLSEHTLEWQRFVWDEVTFAREGAAREAALLVREEQTPVRAVAALGHTTPDTREAYFEQASELAGLLAASAPGDVIGPLACDGGWRLVWLRERKPAAIEDSALRERARTEVVEDALARHLTGRVYWYGQY